MKTPTREQLEALLPCIELFPVADIVLNPNNPRTISQKRFDALVKSVTDFWQMLYLRPVILDENNVALGGNMRTIAARKAGFTVIPVIRAANLTEAQQAEFMVKDNVAFGDWDLDSLANNFDAPVLADWGLTVPSFPPIAYTQAAGLVTSSEGFDEEGSAPKKSKADKAEAGANSFSILVKGNTELERLQIADALTAAGYVEGEHFFSV